MAVIYLFISSTEFFYWLLLGNDGDEGDDGDEGVDGDACEK